MLHNDLSNQVGITVAFRCVDFLVRFRQKKVTDKILNFLVGKEYRAEIDETVSSYMEYLYRNTECNVDLIIENKDYTDALKTVLEDLPFNRIVTIDKMSQISQRLLTGDLTYYVDDDPQRLSEVNSKYAMTLGEVHTILRR